MEFLGVSLNGLSNAPTKDLVSVNIYDIHPVSRWTSMVGLGLFHTGVVVHGKEFSYGGHDNMSAGIYKIPPRDCTWLGDSMEYRTTIQFGFTTRSQREVFKYLAIIGNKFRGNEYNLLCRNCNHFADAFLYFLVKRHLPAFVNRVARVFDYTFSMWIPKSWVQYPCASSNSSASSDSSISPSQASVSSSASNSKKQESVKSCTSMNPPRRTRPPLKEIIAPKLGPTVSCKKSNSGNIGVAEMNFHLAPKLSQSNEDLQLSNFPVLYWQLQGSIEEKDVDDLTTPRKFISAHHVHPPTWQLSPKSMTFNTLKQAMSCSLVAFTALERSQGQTTNTFRVQ